MSLNLPLANETITIPTALARQSQILRQMMTVNATEYIGSYDLLKVVIEVMLTDGRIDPTLLNHPGLRAELRRHGIPVSYAPPMFAMMMPLNELRALPVAVIYHRSGRFRRVVDPARLTPEGLEISSDAIFVPAFDLFPRRPKTWIGLEALDQQLPLVDLFELNDTMFHTDGRPLITRTTIEGGIAPTSFTAGSVVMVKLGTGQAAVLDDLLIRVIPHDQYKIPYPNAWMLPE